MKLIVQVGCTPGEHLSLHGAGTLCMSQGTVLSLFRATSWITRLQQYEPSNRKISQQIILVKKMKIVFVL